MADRGRGGPRQPRNPAPVSTPGSGARTDGGAGSASQPLRVPSGGAYGERKAAIEQQQGAPLPDEGGAPSPSGGGGVPTGGAQPPGGLGGGVGMFDPTTRPDEAITTGISGTPGAPQLTSDELLRVMYRKRPSPYLARLLRDR